jgi:hypothetical protein
MTSFRKLWNTFVDSIKPQLVREHDQLGLHSIFVDTQAFTVTNKGR